MRALIDAEEERMKRILRRRLEGDILEGEVRIIEKIDGKLSVRIATLKDFTDETTD